MDNYTINVTCRIDATDAINRTRALRKLVITHMLVKETKNLKRFVSAPDNNDVFGLGTSQADKYRDLYNSVNRSYFHNLRLIRAPPYNVNYPVNCDNVIRTMEQLLDGPLGLVAAAHRALAAVERSLGTAVFFLPTNEANGSHWIPNVESMSSLVRAQNGRLLEAVHTLWVSEEKGRESIQRAIADH